MAVENNLPGAAASGEHAQPADTKGHLSVSELVSERAAAPSPFGDDQTFPMPVDRVSYTPLTSA